MKIASVKKIDILSSAYYENFYRLTNRLTILHKFGILMSVILLSFFGPISLTAQTVNNGKIHGNPVVYITASKTGRYHSIPNCQGLRFAKSKIIAVRYSDVCKSRKPCKLCCKSLSTNTPGKKDRNPQKPTPITVPDPDLPDVFDRPYPSIPF